MNIELHELEKRLFKDILTKSLDAYLRVLINHRNELSDDAGNVVAYAMATISNILDCINHNVDYRCGLGLNDEEIDTMISKLAIADRDIIKAELATYDGYMH